MRERSSFEMFLLNLFLTRAKISSLITVPSRIPLFSIASRPLMIVQSLFICFGVIVAQQFLGHMSSFYAHETTRSTLLRNNRVIPVNFICERGDFFILTMP